MYDFKVVDYHEDLDHQDLVDLVQEAYPNDVIVPSSPTVIGARSKNIQVRNNEDLIKAYTFSKFVKNVEIMVDGFGYLGHDRIRSMENPILFMIEPGTIIPITDFYDFRWNAFLAYFRDESYDYNANLIWTNGNVSDNYTCLGTFKYSVDSTNALYCPVRENCKRFTTSPTKLTRVSYFTCKKWAIYTQFVNKYYPVKTADYIRTNNTATRLLRTDRSNFYVCSKYTIPTYSHIMPPQMTPSVIQKFERTPFRPNHTEVIIDNIPMVYPDGTWWRVGLELEKVYK